MKPVIFSHQIEKIMHDFLSPLSPRLQGSLHDGSLCHLSFVFVLCPSTFSKDFYSETSEPISFEFHMQPSGKGGKKVYIFG